MPKGSIKAPGSGATMGARMWTAAKNTGKRQGKRIDEATRKLNAGADIRKATRAKASDIANVPRTRGKTVKAPVGKGGK